MQGPSEYRLKYCLWSMKYFLASFLFLRKFCCSFLFFFKGQLESRNLSFINRAEGKRTWDWFLSLSPTKPKLVDSQSCKTNLLIQFFLRVFWGGHVSWNVILFVFVKSVLLMLHVDGLLLLTTRVAGGWLTDSLQKMQEMHFLERNLTVYDCEDMRIKSIWE